MFCDLFGILKAAGRVMLADITYLFLMAIAVCLSNLFPPLVSHFLIKLITADLKDLHPSL
jgi:xanthine/uracil permease